MRCARAELGGVVALLTAGALALTADPAGAGGGDWLFPVDDSYDPGDRVTLAGYTQGVAHAFGSGSTDPDWRTPGPYYAWLRVDPEAAQRDAPANRWPYVHPTDLRLGLLAADERPDDGPIAGWTLRLTTTFRLPEDLAPAAYEVFVCNDPCTTTLGWVMGALLDVGVEPEHPVVPEWPHDEPLIRNLDDGALLVDWLGHGSDLDDWTITAAEVRAGGADDGGGGGLPGEVVGWLIGFGVLLVVWCLAWRVRPRNGRIVVRQGGGPRQVGP
jgi:hypothetical protein